MHWWRWINWWHWIVAHSHLVFIYGYEIFGGILIFWSSAVTEPALPTPARRKHWIGFGLLAIFYIVLGIGIRHGDVKEADENRDELRTLKTNTTSLITSFNNTFPLVLSLSTDLTEIRRDLEAAKGKSDPRLMAALDARIKTAQQHADVVSKDILVALAPTLADQMEKISTSWNEEAHDQDMRHNDLPYQQIPDKLQREQELDTKMAETDKQYGAKLKTIVRQADSLRQEMLQKLPPEARTAEDKKMETRFGDLRKSPSLRLYTLSDEAKYLRELGERLSQETQ